MQPRRFGVRTARYSDRTPVATGCAELDRNLREGCFPSRSSHRLEGVCGPSFESSVLAGVDYPPMIGTGNGLGYPPIVGTVEGTAEASCRNPAAVNSADAKPVKAGGARETVVTWVYGTCVPAQGPAQEDERRRQKRFLLASGTLVPGSC